MIYRSKNYAVLFSLLVLISPLKAMEGQYSSSIVSDKTGFFQRCFGDASPKAIMATQLTIATVMVGGIECFKKSDTLTGFGDLINLTSNEMRTSAAVTGGLVTLSLLGNENVSEGATSLWWRVPFYTLLIAGVHSHTFEYMVGKIPLGIGSALADNNKVSKGLLVIGLGVLLYKGLNKVEKKARVYLIGDEVEGN